jgi:hypothetical protein
LERNVERQFRVIFDGIRELMAPLVKGKRKIGFRAGESERAGVRWLA